jgi:single-strand DNA-binding protein
MISKNHVTIIGRLTDNPTLRTLQIEGKPVSICNFTVAVNGALKKSSQERSVEFIPVSVFGKRGEAVATHVTKGKKVCVEGALHFSKREVEGKKITVGEVRGYQVDWDVERPATPLPAAA